MVTKMDGGYMKREKVKNKNDRTRHKNIRSYVPLYIMMIPGAVYLFINNYIPMTGIVVAFKKYHVQKGIWGSDWCGLDNFKYLFKRDAFVIIRNTLLYNIAFIIINIIVGIILAIMISDVVSKYAKTLYQSAIMLPFLISIIIVSYIVFAFFGAENGMINNTIMKSMGEAPVSWYQEPKYWPFILTFVNTWKGVGYGCLIYIAGIAGIDKSFYEAAELDGATKLQQIRYVTLPCLVPSIITLLLLNVGRIFYSDFGLFYQVPQNSGALFNVTNTIDTYVYRAMITAGNMGQSSAACVFQSIVGFVMIVGVNWVVKKFSKENALF